VNATVDATLVVLAKSPRPGRVKTRLCPPCTPAQAAAIAAAALADTLETVAATRARRHVLALDGPAGPWLPQSFEVIPQVGGGLDRRLAAAMSVADGPVFLVGMDTPQVTAEAITDALLRLATPGVDAVLGRAQDGGWWGLGLVGANPTVFDGVPMSSPRTGAAQLAQLHRLGCTTELLPELRDVDHFSDALAVAELVPGSRFATEVAAIDRTVRRAASVS
jgi:uncharacterized protein